MTDHGEATDRTEIVVPRRCPAAEPHADQTDPQADTAAPRRPEPTEPRAQIVAFMNPAGSTAKTTTTAGIAYIEHALHNKRVLVADTDPQGNLTTALGADRTAPGISQALASASLEWPGICPDEIRDDLRRTVRRTIQHTASGVDIIAADVGLARQIENWNSFSEQKRDYLLADIFDAIHDLYDVIIVDSKGDLGVLTRAVLRSVRRSDTTGRRLQVVCVCLPDLKSVGGLTTLKAEIDRLIEEGDRVELAALNPAKIQHRTRSADADDIYQWLQRSFPDIITPPVRKAPSLDGAYSAGMPITAFDPGAPVARDLCVVTDWLRERKVLP